MVIKFIEPEMLGGFVAQLVKQGLCFEAAPMPGFSGLWQITLTGGY
jgi:hypothetical protein